MNEQYFELILDDKIYSQRTPTSKIIEFTLNNKKIIEYNDLPSKIKEIIYNINNTTNNPNNYFEYKKCDNYIKITGLKKDIGEYLRIPNKIDGLPVIFCNLFNSKNIKNDIKYIYMPNSITELGDSCFANYCNLEYIRLPQTLKTIPETCFKYCTKLKEINLSNIENIYFHAFDSCTSLTSVDISNTTFLDSGVFQNCTNLKNVKLCDKLKDIRKDTFIFCFDLKKITLPEGLMYLGEGAFEQCEKLEKINFPNTLKMIGKRCFIHCKNLKKFIAPPNLKEIDNNAFSYSGLEHIVLNKKSNVNFFAFNFTKPKEISLYEHQKKCLSVLKEQDMKIINLSEKEIDSER